MNAKTIVGGVIGGIIYFLLGWLVYGIIFADSMEGAQCMRPHDAVLPLWIGIGNIFTGLFISYVFSRMGNVNSFGSGAMTGAIMGILVTIGFDCLMYGVSTMMPDPTGILWDVVFSAIFWAIMGGVIGWWLGRGAKMTGASA